MRESGYDAVSLEKKLGYNSKGLLVRTYLGVIESAKPPSEPFIQRLQEAGFDGAEISANLHVTKDTYAKCELPAGTVVFGEPAQCPECAAEAEEGKRAWTETWYVFPWGNQKYCCREHRRAWYRRQQREDQDVSTTPPRDEASAAEGVS
jgi:hypothetical protein